MADSIRLSEKHGVNPSLDICFWCGEPRGVALMGRLKGDAEAPRQVIVDYEPCDTCREKFEQGILLVEAATQPLQENQRPISEREGIKIYPTGGHAVVKEEAIPRIFDHAAVAALLRARRGFMDTESFNRLVPPEDDA